MKHQIFYWSYAIAFLSIIFSLDSGIMSAAQAENAESAAVKSAPVDPSKTFLAEVQPKTLTGNLPADNKVLRIGDSGRLPKDLVMTKPGSSLFVLNDTIKQDLSIEIDFGQKPGFCATGAMKMGEDGIFRSRKALKPGHFLVVCFAHAGSYEFVAQAGSNTAKGGPRSRVFARTKIKVSGT